MARSTAGNMAQWAIELRAVRTSAGLTQQQLAQKIGLSQPTIACYEKGIRYPDTQTLDAWTAACGARIEIVPSGKDPIGSVPAEIVPEIRSLLEGYVRAPEDVRSSIRLLLQKLGR